MSISERYNLVIVSPNKAAVAKHVSAMTQTKKEMHARMATSINARPTARMRL